MCFAFCIVIAYGLSGNVNFDNHNIALQWILASPLHFRPFRIIHRIPKQFNLNCWSNCLHIHRGWDKFCSLPILMKKIEKKYCILHYAFRQTAAVAPYACKTWDHLCHREHIHQHAPALQKIRKRHATEHEHKAGGMAEENPLACSAIYPVTMSGPEIYHICIILQSINARLQCRILVHILTVVAVPGPPPLFQLLFHIWII